MKTQAKITALLLVLASLTRTDAQSFMPGFDIFSKKKTAYLTLTDGSKTEGQIDRLERKQNNISNVRMVINGKVKEYSPEAIKEMYLPAHELNKFSLKMENTTNTSVDYDLRIINEGYAYFEKTEVLLGKNSQILMMQLVNPGFSSKIKVYFDPMAVETMQMSVGPLSTGGIDRSYFVKLEGKPAFKLSKANYDQLFKDLYADCPDLLSELGKTPEWKDLAEHISKFDLCNP